MQCYTLTPWGVSNHVFNVNIKIKTTKQTCPVAPRPLCCMYIVVRSTAACVMTKTYHSSTVHCALLSYQTQNTSQLHPCSRGEILRVIIAKATHQDKDKQQCRNNHAYATVRYSPHYSSPYSSHTIAKDMATFYTCLYAEISLIHVTAVTNAVPDSVA